MKFIENYPVKDLHPADYNPRKINKTQFKKLKESIKKFGIVKPVIVNGENGILTAGHQRVRAIKELEIKNVPVIKLEKIVKSDEIMFNLFHNSIETNLSKVVVSNSESLPFGYNYVNPKFINFEKNLNPAIVKEIGKLIVKYGEWGSVVCSEKGEVVSNSDYAVACKVLDKPLLVYKMENSKIEDFLRYVRMDYGKYYFDTLNIKDYNQTYCQMNRLSGKRSFKSTTYERYVLPNLDKHQRLLDFGAGKCAYAKMLKKAGYKAFMYEPFFRKEKERAFDIGEILEFIKEIELDIAKNGLFDIVVLDSVLNSVTCQKMQHNVLLTCNSLLKETGVLILGTRCLGSAEIVYNQKKSTGPQRDIEFLDDDNFSVTFRNGVWTKQRFNTKDNLQKELSPYFNNIKIMGSKTSSNIYAICKEPLRWSLHEYKKTLNAEFNMTYPGGFKHNKHKKLVEIILKTLFAANLKNN